MSNEVAIKFTEQIASCQGIILKICRIYGKDAIDREDLRQDILLNAWISFPQFRGDAKFSTWLYRVALNTAIGRFRKKKVNEQPMTATYDHVVDSESEKSRQLELLDELLRNLTDDEKALVALYLDELSYEEIAQITGLTESNVGVKLNRIKLKLKKLSDGNRA